jgi:hypothetical protein
MEWPEADLMHTHKFNIVYMIKEAEKFGFFCVIIVFS